MELKQFKIVGENGEVTFSKGPNKELYVSLEGSHQSMRLGLDRGIKANMDCIRPLLLKLDEYGCTHPEANLEEIPQLDMVQHLLTTMFYGHVVAL